MSRPDAVDGYSHALQSIVTCSRSISTVSPPVGRPTIKWGQRCRSPSARNQGAEWTAARPHMPAVRPSRSGQQPASHGLFSAAPISRPRGMDCGEVLANAPHPLAKSKDASRYY